MNKLIEKFIEKLTLSDKFYLGTVNKVLTQTTISYPKEWKIIHFKTYPRLGKIRLGRKTCKNKKVFLDRRSEREYIKKAISFDIFSKILYTSAGITSIKDTIDGSRRTYPSAGARYPLEVYIIILDVLGLDEGIYHYNVRDNTLEELQKKGMSTWILDSTGGEEWILNSGFLIIITGVPDRIKIKYHERGFRYMLIEVGHLAQNFILTARGEGVASCPMGGFIEDYIISMLDIGNVKEYPLYMISFGYSKDE